jgi:hypothetical protein
MLNIRSEALVVVKVDEICSGCQLCQLVKYHRRLRDHLRPYHQTWLIAQEYLISFHNFFPFKVGLWDHIAVYVPLPEPTDPWLMYH